MDWERSYYTMTDPNIYYIWGFLQVCNERGWLYKGHRSMPWCPRCGTSLSQHELIDSYKDLTHPSLHVRMPLAGRDREYLVVWTTTPWTLPANVAAAVRPDADYVRVETASGIAIVAAARLEASPIVGRVLGTVRGSELVGLTYTAPFDELPAQGSFENRVVAWDDVVDGGGHGHRPHRAGLRRGGLRARQARGPEALIPVDEAGAFFPEYGWLHGHVTAEAAQMIVDDLGQRGRLVARRRDHPPLSRLLALRHRADLPARRRVVHPLRRDPRADDRGRPRSGVDAAAVRQADGGLAAQHGRLVHQPQALLGPAAAVLLLRRTAT